MEPREQQKPKRPWMMIVVAVSTAVHAAFLGAASLFPAPPPEPARFVRIEVMQFHQNGDGDDWGNEGRVWAIVSNDRLRASTGP